jgi:hypothetical protein
MMADIFSSTATLTIGSMSVAWTSANTSSFMRR